MWHLVRRSHRRERRYRGGRILELNLDGAGGTAHRRGALAARGHSPAGVHGRGERHAVDSRSRLRQCHRSAFGDASERGTRAVVHVEHAALGIRASSIGPRHVEGRVAHRGLARSGDVLGEVQGPQRHAARGAAGARRVGHLLRGRDGSRLHRVGVCLAGEGVEGVRGRVAEHVLPAIDAARLIADAHLEKLVGGVAPGGGPRRAVEAVSAPQDAAAQRDALRVQGEPVGVAVLDDRLAGSQSGSIGHHGPLGAPVLVVALHGLAQLGRRVPGRVGRGAGLTGHGRDVLERRAAVCGRRQLGPVCEDVGAVALRVADPHGDAIRPGGDAEPVRSHARGVTGGLRLAAQLRVAEVRELVPAGPGVRDREGAVRGARRGGNGDLPVDAAARGVDAPGALGRVRGGVIGVRGLRVGLGGRGLVDRERNAVGRTAGAHEVHVIGAVGVVSGHLEPEVSVDVLVGRSVVVDGAVDRGVRDLALAHRHAGRVEQREGRHGRRDQLRRQREPEVAACWRASRLRPVGGDRELMAVCDGGDAGAHAGERVEETCGRRRSGCHIGLVRGGRCRRLLRGLSRGDWLSGGSQFSRRTRLGGRRRLGRGGHRRSRHGRVGGGSDLCGGCRDGREPEGQDGDGDDRHQGDDPTRDGDGQVRCASDGAGYCIHGGPLPQRVEPERSSRGSSWRSPQRRSAGTRWAPACHTVVTVLTLPRRRGVRSGLRSHFWRMFQQMSRSWCVRARKDGHASSLVAPARTDAVIPLAREIQPNPTASGSAELMSPGPRTCSWRLVTPAWRTWWSRPRLAPTGRSRARPPGCAHHAAAPRDDRPARCRSADGSHAGPRMTQVPPRLRRGLSCGAP